MFINTCANGKAKNTIKNWIDIDECSANDSCDQNATCKNTIGSYDCTCNIGYDGDGKTCNGKLDYMIYTYMVIQNLIRC